MVQEEVEHRATQRKQREATEKKHHEQPHLSGCPQRVSGGEDDHAEFDERDELRHRPIRICRLSSREHRPCREQEEPAEVGRESDATLRRDARQRYDDSNFPERESVRCDDEDVEKQAEQRQAHLRLGAR